MGRLREATALKKTQWLVSRADSLRKSPYYENRSLSELQKKELVLSRHDNVIGRPCEPLTVGPRVRSFSVLMITYSWIYMRTNIYFTMVLSFRFSSRLIHLQIMIRDLKCWYSKSHEDEHECNKDLRSKNGNEFKVNSQCLKPFLKSMPKNEMALGLFDPMYQ